MSFVNRTSLLYWQILISILNLLFWQVSIRHQDEFDDVDFHAFRQQDKRAVLDDVDVHVFRQQKVDILSTLVSMLFVSKTMLVNVNFDVVLQQEQFCVLLDGVFDVLCQNDQVAVLVDI